MKFSKARGFGVLIAVFYWRGIFTAIGYWQVVMDISSISSCLNMDNHLLIHQLMYLMTEPLSDASHDRESDEPLYQGWPSLSPFSEVPTGGRPQISASLRSCAILPRPGGPAVSQFPSPWWVVLQKGLITNRSLVQPRLVTCCVWWVTQSCPTLCNPMDYNLPCSSVHGIFQARILEWVAISSPRGSSRPRDPTHVPCISCIGRWVLYHCTTWKAQMAEVQSLPDQ